MSKHSGSARDPLSYEPSKSSFTPGMVWVVIGFVAIVTVVAAANTGILPLPGGPAHVAGAPSGQG